MEQYLEFIAKHWLLSLTLIVIVLAIIFEENKNKLKAAKGLSPQAVTMLLSHDEAIAIDIREVAIFNKEHILSSINVPVMENLSDRLKKLTISPEKKIIIIDASGNSVMPIIKKLRDSGYEKIDFLSGGIFAWKTANLPLVNK